MNTLDAIKLWCGMGPEPTHDLEPEQISALKYMYKVTIFPCGREIEENTGCDELALGDLLFKGLIRPVFDGSWFLTEAGMREAKR